MTNLWHENTPRNFWLCQPDPPEEAWLEAYQNTFPCLGLTRQVDDIDAVTLLTLGEGQFGSDHWKLSPTKQLYYTLKPFLPRSLRYALRRQYSQSPRSYFQLDWPIEERYVRFQFEVARQLLTVLDQSTLAFRYFWPGEHRYALVLTHDIETGPGQAYARTIADLEERLGFRSSFNFVSESYDIDYHLMQELRERGFEIGVHGLKHDGKLFSSRTRFMERAERINQYLREFGAVGFRSPLMMRNPEWMQALKIEYDLSFFDTDPYEPMPGGVMSIWPFTIGHYIELPYTLPQDSTLCIALGETTPQLWMRKLDFIEQYNGMALVNTHPDYLKDPIIRDIYTKFLLAVKERGAYWHALPCEVARWWRRRIESPGGQEFPELNHGTILLDDDHIAISSPMLTSREPSEVDQVKY